MQRYRSRLGARATITVPRAAIIGFIAVAVIAIAFSWTAQAEPAADAAIGLSTAVDPLTVEPRTAAIPTPVPTATPQPEAVGQPQPTPPPRAEVSSRGGSRPALDISTPEKFIVPTASDGSTLWEQPQEVQEPFIDSYGDEAPRVWAEQHSRNLGIQTGPQSPDPESSTTATPATSEPSVAEALSAATSMVPRTASGDPLRVGIQAGHWKSEELPEELSGLRGSTGAAGSGWREVDVNLDIARRVAALLSQAKVQVDLLPATVPPDYKADAFVALHGDANGNTAASGYKLARYSSSSIPAKDDALLRALSAEYRAASGLREHPQTITQNMLRYYAFNQRLEHSVAPTTPAVILEMGFLTNQSDRALLTREPDRVAAGIAKGIMSFLGI